MTTWRQALVHDPVREYYNRFVILTVVARDEDKHLQDLLEYLKSNGNGGHSFSIVVDPGDAEKEKKFFWDGDGSDRIESITEAPFKE
jgi:sulfatase maturation enzyme AslB (radical SAM superfamily)